MEEVSRYGGELRIYWICCCEQLTMGAYPAVELGRGLPSLHCKNQRVTRC
jgi:hypothetical protein